jgi:hypothetical protein
VLAVTDVVVSGPVPLSKTIAKATVVALRRGPCAQRDRFAPIRNVLSGRSVIVGAGAIHGDGEHAIVASSRVGRGSGDRDAGRGNGLSRRMTGNGDGWSNGNDASGVRPCMDEYKCVDRSQAGREIVSESGRITGEDSVRAVR